MVLNWTQFFFAYFYFISHVSFPESLKAIAETIQVAYEVSGLGELEFITRVAQRKTSVLLSENFRTSDVQFSSLKNVGKNYLISFERRFRVLDSDCWRLKW